jgi:DNA adenine methylase
MDVLKTPFPYFGGKSRIAPMVWERFGKVANYVEPFFGSGAVLLSCPHPGHTETVNDADGLLCNFFRALQAAPDAVAQYADYPVNELDLHARHRWLVHQRADVERLLDDPEWYDAKTAGWWVWGISQWIGSGWCARSGKTPYKRPADDSPALIAQVGDLHRKIPHLGDEGRGIHRPAHTPALVEYFHALAARLRRTRVTCGDFARVLGPSVTWRHGLTAVFLDPPYDLTERAAVYAVETDAARRAREWAIANEDNPMLRIALCGYDSIEMPDDWQALRWKAAGGYGNQGDGRGRKNAGREVVWFSPNCLNPIELARNAMTRPLAVRDTDYTGTLFDL